MVSVVWTSVIIGTGSGGFRAAVDDFSTGRAAAQFVSVNCHRFVTHRHIVGCNIVSVNFRPTIHQGILSRYKLFFECAGNFILKVCVVILLNRARIHPAVVSMLSLVNYNWRRSCLFRWYFFEHGLNWTDVIISMGSDTLGAKVCTSETGTSWTVAKVSSNTSRMP